MTDQDGRLNISIADRSLRLFADPEMLGTAIINLVDNALKYSDRPIEIDAHDAGGGLVIRVRDRGIGIPAEELSRIGRSFFRASHAATPAGPGRQSVV